jgi:hypothetical protein
METGLKTRLLLKEKKRIVLYILTFLTVIKNHHYSHIPSLMRINRKRKNEEIWKDLLGEFFLLLLT